MKETSWMVFELCDGVMEWWSDGVKKWRSVHVTIPSPRWRRSIYQPGAMPRVRNQIKTARWKRSIFFRDYCMD